METQSCCVSTVCTHSLPGTHVCPVHTDTGKRYNTLHAFLLLSTALYLLYWLSCLSCLIRQCSTLPLTVSLSLFTSLSRPLSLSLLFLCFHTAVRWNFTTALIIHEDSELACVRNSLFSSALCFSSMWHCNDRRAIPAGFCLTEKSQAKPGSL